MTPELERAFADLAFGAPVDAANPASVDAWLARSGVSSEDAAAIRAGDLRRTLFYRTLVRFTLRNVVELACPRLVARLGPTFDEWFDRFLAERGPQTHYVRDVTLELLDFVALRWPGDERVPTWALDLGRHESLRVEIGAMQSGSVLPEPEALELDAPVAFIQASRVVRYAHAVHRLSDDVNDRTEPESTPTALFVYRSPEHDVRYLELTPLAAAILEGLHSGATLRGAVVRGVEAEDARLDAGVLESTARVLADLAARGALVGAARA